MSSDLELRLNQLDELLEKYLELVDKYETARGDLSKGIASGFFSLARANNSGNKRFGQDYYDYRMQAQKVVQIEPTSSEKETNSHVEGDPPSFKISIKTPQEESEEVKSKDPITWFGVLVPPSLRAAKDNFCHVVDVSIPKVLEISSQLRQMEIEIGRLRKSIKKLEKSAEAGISSEKHAG